jgi:hypothetical protein
MSNYNIDALIPKIRDQKQLLMRKITFPWYLNLLLLMMHKYQCFHLLTHAGFITLLWILQVVKCQALRITFPRVQMKARTIRICALSVHE